MKKGNINVSVENIFPLIKKFLYSDHEIFLRELISNATDATLKLKHIAGIGKEKIEVGEPTIEVKIDKKGKKNIYGVATPEEREELKEEGIELTTIPWIDKEN